MIWARYEFDNKRGALRMVVEHLMLDQILRFPCTCKP